MYDSAKAHDVLGHPLLLHVSSAESQGALGLGLVFRAYRHEAVGAGSYRDEGQGWVSSVTTTRMLVFAGPGMLREGLCL